MKWYYGTMPRLVVASVLAFGISGCGWLISSDVTETSFDLPQRRYSFDAATFNAPSGITNEVPCGVAPVVDCCNPDPPLPRPDCATTPLACEQNENGMMVCTATVTVSQGSMVNLGQDVQQLAPYSGYVEIKIKRIGYSVTANTLNVDLPAVILYLAPEGITDPADASAVKFGTLPPIGAETTVTGDVILEPNAAQVLSMFTQNIRAPLTFIAATTLRVTRSPIGKIDMTITGKLAASL
jgi:hypothetical protein